MTVVHLAGRSARARAVALAAASGLLAAACSSAAPGSGLPTRARGGAAGPAGGSASARPRPAATDPPGAGALVRIAQVFNNEYDNGDFGAVYDRWDARSQALISRAEYIRRHVLCAPATHETATVEGAAPAAATGGAAAPSSPPAAGGSAAPPDGQAWHVRYEIAGQQLVDTWYYVGHRWVFDIIASNPGAARLYGMPFQRYVAAVGCSAH